MTIKSKTTAPTRMEAIERLVRTYGDARVDQAGIGTHAAKVRSEEAMAQVLAAWHSGVTTTDPTLDERLRVVYNPDLDYGIDLGPTPPLAGRHRLLERVVLGTTLILRCTCGEPPLSGLNHAEVAEMFTAHCEIENAAELDSPDLPAAPVDYFAAPAEPVAVSPERVTVPVATREQIDTVVRGWYRDRLPVAGKFDFDDETRSLSLKMRKIEHVTAWAEHLGGLPTGGTFAQSDTGSVQIARYFHDATHPDLPGWTITVRWDFKVSPERVAEILAELSGLVNTQVSVYVARLDKSGELVKVLRSDAWGYPCKIELVGGVVLTQQQDNTWSAVTR